MIDPLTWNAGNLNPTAERPLYFIVRGQAPSLKNDRDHFVTKQSTVGSRPKAEVTQFIQKVRDSVKRQLPAEWKPIMMTQQVALLVIVGAHAVTSIPDMDADNAYQTIQEALAFPRVKGKEVFLPTALIQNDRQVVDHRAPRVPFAVKENIYNQIFFWATTGELCTLNKEMALVGELICQME